MKIEIFRQRRPDVICTGDGIHVEGHGECMVIELTDTAAGLFSVMSTMGVVLPLRLNFPTTNEAPTTLQ